LLSLVGRKVHNFLATVPGLASTTSARVTYITQSKPHIHKISSAKE